MSYTNTYSEIYHHGIKGQKWGVRNYQNPDGSLTPLGRQHYGYSTSTEVKDDISTREKKKTLKKLNKYNKRLEAIQFEQQLYDTNESYKRALNDYKIDREKLRENLKAKEKECNKIINDILNEHGDRIITNKTIRTYETEIENRKTRTTYIAKERLGKRYVDKTLTAIQSAKTDMGNSKIDAASRFGTSTGFIGSLAGVVMANPFLSVGGTSLAIASGIVNIINSKEESESVYSRGATVATRARTEEYYDKL